MGKGRGEILGSPPFTYLLYQRLPLRPVAVTENRRDSLPVRFSYGLLIKTVGTGYWYGYRNHKILGTSSPDYGCDWSSPLVAVADSLADLPFPVTRSMFHHVKCIEILHPLSLYPPTKTIGVKSCRTEFGVRNP